jgi:hypothetical protein
MIGKKISGRLDWSELAEAASRLLNDLPKHYFPSR